MSSLGREAYVGTLNADTINYKTLNPALQGFVHNPLNSALQGAGNNIDLQGGNLTCDTLQYSSLDPPINPGITNPLTAGTPLDCNSNNIINANDIQSTSANFSNSALGTATATSLTASGQVAGNSGNFSNSALGTATATSLTASSGDFSSSLSLSGGLFSLDGYQTLKNLYTPFNFSGSGNFVAPTVPVDISGTKYPIVNFTASGGTLTSFEITLIKTDLDYPILQKNEVLVHLQTSNATQFYTFDVSMKNDSAIFSHLNLKVVPSPPLAVGDSGNIFLRFFPLNL
jgi:hypothetical protein